MSLLHDLLDFIRDPGPTLAVIGYWGMFAVIFIETGLLFPFLPGDSLLVVAGIYAARGTFNLGLLMLLLIPAAILGDAISYTIGKKAGPKLFSRPKSWFFRPSYAQAAHRFFEKHGGKAIIIARFMPIVRTYVPVIAGVGQMPYRRFAFFNVIGAVSWIVSMTLCGYFLGEVAAAAGFPLDKHLEKVIIIVVFLSILPGIIAGFIEWRKKRAAARTEAAP
jgi:membrane-associated protein